MSRYPKLLVLLMLIVGLMLPTTLVAVGCGEEDTTTTAEKTTATADESQALAERANEVLSADAGDYPGNSITAEKLSGMLADPAMSEQVYVLDIRSADDYAAGHIEGAVNIPFANWAEPDSLDMLPTDKTIAVACYTGHTAAEVVGGLRMLGFDAVTLRAGMMGWTQGASTQKVADELLAADHPVVNTPADPSASGTSSGALTEPSDDLYETIAGLANTDMSSMPTSGDYANNVITADNLGKMLVDPAMMEMMYLLDIRSAADYQDVGHIEGAVNIPFKDVGVPENLDMLPKDKKIVVICYTGNTAAQTTMILRILGYDAAVLKFGSMGWAANSMTQGYVDSITTANYPVVQGAGTTTGSDTGY